MNSLLINKRDRLIHYMMIWNGGLLGGYAILLRDNFGNAMTGNLMQLFVDISLHDLSMIASRIGALFVYILSFMLSTALKNHTKINMRRLTPIVVIAGMIAASCIPVDEEIDPILALYPIFFISAFQWNTFGGADGYASSTIFISNNTRQFACALADYICTKDVSYRKRAFFYGMSVFMFCVGVYIDCILSIRFRQYAILMGIVPMILTEILLATVPDQSQR